MTALPEHLAEFIQKLHERFAQNSTIDATHRVLANLSADLGMSTFIFAYSYNESLTAPRHHVITNADRWMDHYMKANLRSRDPIVKYIVERNTPVRWNDLPTMPNYCSDEQLDVMRQAAEFGMSYGVSIPCRSADCLGVLSFAGDSPTSLQNCDALMIYGPILSNHLLDCVRGIDQVLLAPGKEAAEKVSPREIDALYWASEGKTAWEIGKIMSISERTVVFHLTNATTKLGASSRQHAISKAILLGILVPRF